LKKILSSVEKNEEKEFKTLPKFGLYVIK